MILLSEVRLVPLTGPAPAGPVDVLLADGRVAAVGPRIRPPAGADVVPGEGRWLIPGLWDHHVHMSQWVQTRGRLDVSGARSPDDVVRIVAGRVAAAPDGAAVIGFGYRSADWTARPTTAALDAVSGDRPVVVVSGDVHSGWLNSRARALLGAPGHDGLLEEAEWFAVMARMADLTGTAEAVEAAYGDALRAAAALGVVGVTDLEFDASSGTWPRRFRAGLTSLRVRIGVYPEALAGVLAAGLRTGDAWPGCDGRVVVGPLKVISDGSLGTRTAHCHDPYPAVFGDLHPYGRQNVAPDALTSLLATATAHGLEVAVHAIGDAAVDIALDAVAATGARGGVEHAQLTTDAQLARMAALGVRASVQPAHLLDDRDLAAVCWPGREGRMFRLRSMLDAGVRVVLGSDAPVARLDPWLAMAAAVHRSGDARPAWHPEEAITAREALAASTDGRGTVAPGHPADLVLLDDDPLPPGAPEEVAARLRQVRVALTVVDGRIVHADPSR